ncbi:MAG TPA: hypothetical protein DCM05_06360 [Elusimicrobia bacterium]|nr:hypothetical protein [Elusimicrobiota bacterium]
MIGIQYAKSDPTTYVLHYQNGQVRREGAGLSFLYFAPVSTIIKVPLGSRDLPFVFSETTLDFQEVAIQGQLSYRVREPRKLAAMLDFSAAPDGGLNPEGLEQLGTRLVLAAQVLTRSIVQRRPLREALVSLDAIVAEVRGGLSQAEAVGMLGVEILSVSVQGIRPAPEMAKALEAEARERLKKEADLAIYERRNASVQQERIIKESELATELSVEERRAALVEQRAANERKSAESQAYQLEAVLKPLRDMDWRVLSAVSAGGVSPGLMIASAFRDLAENARKIGQLNVSPELLQSLLKKDGG